MNTLKAYLRMDMLRILPFLGVIGILILIGTVMLYLPETEFSKMGFLLLRHLTIVFALILGADLAARDREQKTRTGLEALPKPPLETFLIRCMIRLAVVLILWGTLIVYTDHILGAVFPGRLHIVSLVHWYHSEADVTHQASVIILSIFTFFSGTLCSMFMPDTLTSIGASAAVAVGCALYNSRYNNSYMVTILLLMVIFALLSALIYASRQPWDLFSQSKRLLVGFSAVVLVLLLI